MNKTSNKLILIFGAILAFSFALPAYAETVTVDSGVIFNPSGYSYNTSYQRTTPVYNTPVYYTAPVVYTTPLSIAGCEGRNTGFSTVTGESCAGNYVEKPTTIIVENTNSSKTNTATVAKKDGYGSLAANALLGSNSFMPSGLLQWIFFIVLIVSIIYLWRYVYGKHKYLSEPLKHA